MNLAAYAIRHRAVTLVFTLLVTAGGMLAYGKLGKLEDPDFTIKTAVISTVYSGATAEEVESEVTEKIESAVQQLKQLDKVRSISRPGLSIVYADMQDQYDKSSLPQVWDELRRKVGAVSLPSGCGTPSVNDDFGDVYGIFFALTGDGYSYHDLKEVADDLRRELLLCDNVGRIDFWGAQTEMVYVEIDRAKLAQLGLTPTAIFTTISAQNSVSAAGEVKVCGEDMRLRVTGAFKSVSDLGEVLVKGGEGRMIRVKDVATISRGYLDPPQTLLYRSDRGPDGKWATRPAVGLGISTVLGGNVVVMGEAVKKRLEELADRIPVGVELNAIAYQAETVRESVEGFVWNLVESVVIVILLLVVFMGLREGFIMGLVLLVTVFGTLLGMQVLDVTMQRISLGALIIALGMLVDNAIVVAENTVVKSIRGLPREQAAEEAVEETKWPLLGATCVAILAFAAISISKDVTGEFLGSLFTVIALSLGLSWVFAVTVTPYLCVVLLPKNMAAEKDPHDRKFYHIYSAFLRRCIDHKPITLALVAGMLALAIFGFRFIPRNFFPDSSRPQFTVSLWMPEGTHIAATERELEKLRQYVATLDGVSDINSFAGSGAMRFILTYSPEAPSGGYGQLLVTVDDYRKIGGLIDKVRGHVAERCPEAVVKVERFRLGPSADPFEARFSGPDASVLRGIADRAEGIIHADAGTLAVRDDWGARIKVARVRMAEARAREAGVTRAEIAEATAMNFSGYAAGVYRDGDKLLPIVLRPPAAQRGGIDSLGDVQVWSGVTGRALPIGQVTDRVETAWEEPCIQRRNRLRTVTVSCQQIEGTADTLFRRLRGPLEAIPLPEGYSLEWGGEFEKSRDANRKLMANVPLAFAIMFFVTLMLFNTLRHPIIIFMGLPLALIGVTAGLLVSGFPFGFMATLGFLSLAGMLIKNEVVLLDQINLDRAQGKDPYHAVVDAAVSRVRPVCMAAFTTVLGMIPLLTDPFFGAMAVTIMAGLTFATVLTLVVVPVLYAAFFHVRRPAA